MKHLERVTINGEIYVARRCEYTGRDACVECCFEHGDHNCLASPPCWANSVKGDVSVVYLPEATP